MEKVTNKDIAQRAGVSQAAVSMALHGKKGISEATRSHILRIARELNYEPPARSRQPSGSIVLLIHSMQERLIPGVLDGLLRRAAEQDAELKVLTLSQVLEDPRSRLEDCSFLVTFDTVERVHLNQFSSLVPNILVIDGSYSRKPFWNIRIDYAGAAYDLTRYLSGLGHRSFLYLNEELVSARNLICFSGFQRLILEQHLPLNPDQIIMDANVDRNVWSHLESIVAANNISAVVCTSDQTAVHAIDQLTSLGYRVPEDLSVAAIVGSSGVVHPGFSLTSVSLGEDHISEQVYQATAPRKYSAQAADTVIPPGPVSVGRSTAAPKFNPAAKTLALALYLKDHPTMRVARAGFLDSVRRMGYQAKVVGTTAGDNDSFAEAVRALPEMNVDGVALWLAVPEAVETIAAAGIPLVCLHTPIADHAETPVQCNITEDPVAVGREAAAFFAERLQGRSGSVAVNQSGDNSLETGITREFTLQLERACPGIRVRTDLEFAAYHNRANVDLVVEFARRTPDLLGAFTTAGWSCANWAAARQMLNRPDLIIVGTDYTNESLALLENGEIQAIVAQPIYEETQTSVVALDAILRGKDFPAAVRLEAPLITAGNAKKYRLLLQEIFNWYA